MLRAAAKNHGSVIAICDPSDYNFVVEMIEFSGGIDRRTRFNYAMKAFQHTADYDRMIADHYVDCFKRGVEPDQGIKH